MPMTALAESHGWRWKSATTAEGQAKAVSADDANKATLIAALEEAIKVEAEDRRSK